MPNGSKVVAVVPVEMPSSAIWLMAVTAAAGTPARSVKPWSVPAGRAEPRPCAVIWRVMNSAICQRSTVPNGANVVAVVPVEMP